MDPITPTPITPPDTSAPAPATIAPSTPNLRYYGSDPALLAGVAAVNGQPTSVSSTDEQAVRDQTAKGFQANIDAINTAADKMIQDATDTSANTAGSVRAAEARTGTLGSPIATTMDAGVAANREKAIAATQSDREAKLGTIANTITANSNALITAKRHAAAQNLDQATKIQGQVKQSALDIVKSVAVAGKANLEDAIPADQLQQLQDQSGMSQLELDQYFNAQKPANAQVDWKFVTDQANNKVIAYGVNPATGELQTKNYSYAVPGGYKVVTTKQGQTFLYNDQTGDMKPVTGNGGNIYRDATDNFFSVDASGNKTPIDQASFQKLGINADFVPRGQTVSMAKATTGREDTTSATGIAGQQALTAAKTNALVNKNVPGSNYTKDLAQAKKDIYAGVYGYAGAREKALAALQAKYPNVKTISSDVYNTIAPDGYEQNIKGGGYGKATVVQRSRTEAWVRANGGTAGDMAALKNDPGFFSYVLDKSSGSPVPTPAPSPTP